MSTIDLRSLKELKKQLQERIGNVEYEREKVENILARKYENHNKVLGEPKLKIAEASDGRALSDFRSRSTKTAATALGSKISLPKLFTTISIIPAPVIDGSKAQKLRLQDALRKKGKREIARRMEVTEVKKEIIPVKLNKVGSSIPIPASLFPNRYKRGELPCSIEHGVGNLSYIKYQFYNDMLNRCDCFQT